MQHMNKVLLALVIAGSVNNFAVAQTTSNSKVQNAGCKATYRVSEFYAPDSTHNPHGTPSHDNSRISDSPETPSANGHPHGMPIGQ